MVPLLQVTKPFSDASYGAGGSEKPSGGDIDALAQQARLAWLCAAYAWCVSMGGTCRRQR